MVSRLLNNIRETLIVFHVNKAKTALLQKDFIFSRKHAFDTFHLIHYRITELDKQNYAFGNYFSLLFKELYLF